MIVSVALAGWIYYSKGKNGQIAYIPETIGEIGVHNMTAICVEAPYQIATSASRRADFSIRVGVNNT